MRRRSFFIISFILLAILILIQSPDSLLAYPIPDTGSTNCYDAEGNVIEPCPQPGEPFFGQDGNHLINPPSYTKLDGNGNDLEDSATIWSMIRDNVTGLIWEVKKDSDGTPDYTNHNDADNTYSWCDMDSASNGGNQGLCVDNGTDTEDYLNALNSNAFGGYSDWRLPDIKELASIVALDKYNPAIRSNIFPNTQTSNYWSSTTYSDSNMTKAWAIEFIFGGDASFTDNGGDKSNSYYVRAVRSSIGQESVNRFYDNGDGTVTDVTTGLMWQQTSSVNSMTWQDGLAYAENLELGGSTENPYDDWRVPTREELRSLLDYEFYGPAVDINRFEGSGLSYWSSTSLTEFPLNPPRSAWGINFHTGFSSKQDKSLNSKYIRAVRGGESEKVGTPGVILIDPIIGENFGGTTVTLYGYNFADTQGAGQVTFDGIQAEIISSSETEIVCLTPPHKAGAVDVIVTADNNKTVTEVNGFTYYYVSPIPHPIPDTGPTVCYDRVDGNLVDPCPKPGEPYYGQDGNYLINPPSFNKLDGTGNTLDDSANSWHTVRDNVTGLIWAAKDAADGQTDYNNPNDADNTYTWCDSNPATNGGNQGTCGENTDTEDFIAALNDIEHGGYSDWRLPTAKELQIILLLRNHHPEVRDKYFPNDQGGWSSTAARIYNSSHFLYVSAVRGQGMNESSDRFIDNADGTISDTETGLMWQKNTGTVLFGGNPYIDRMSWSQGQEYVENLELGDIAGTKFKDWRLPAREELHSLVDYSASIPVIDTTFFPDTVYSPSETPEPYLTSTPVANSPSNMWRLDFANAKFYLNDIEETGSTGYVRAVRAGKSAEALSTINPDSGLDTGGITINISGSGFGNEQGTGQVLFGETEATVLTWTDNEIVCLSPVHGPGLVYVIVTTGGNTAKVAGTFAYYVDADGDGYSEDIDCDDNDSSVHTAVKGYSDIDNDGFTTGGSQIFCTGDGQLPEGFIEIQHGEDNNDGDASIYPGAPELCDEKDNNQDGQVDENFVCGIPLVNRAVPDTGQTSCYDNDGNLLDPCPQLGEPFHGQDSSYLINPPSYTKLGSNGAILTDLAPDWSMVRDNVTGLVWEVKHAGDGIRDYSNPNDADNTYTWCDTNPDTNGGESGRCEIIEGSTSNTENFIAALNSSNYGGYSDWRLPTINELKSILLLDRYDPAINNDFFWNIHSSQNTDSAYWASTTYNFYPLHAWAIGFWSGVNFHRDKQLENGFRVMAVRGRRVDNTTEERFRDNGDGTVTDRSTGLMWQQATPPGTYTWQQALDYAEKLLLGGSVGNKYEDWRLPTIKELGSIVDHGRYSPTIDTSLFPGTLASIYWASTNYAYDPSRTWYLDFSSGASYAGYRTNFGNYYIRAVRSGENAPVNSLSVSMIKPEKGPTSGGTEITISGSGFREFQGTGSVRFGGNVAVITSWSEIEIICISPPGTTGVVDLTVTADNGESDTETGAFTYFVDSDGDGVPADSDCNDNDVNSHVIANGYADVDGDGYTSGPPKDFCSGGDLPVGYLPEQTDEDLDDADETIYPKARELCDSKDNDQDGLVDEGYVCGAPAPFPIPDTGPTVCYDMDGNVVAPCPAPGEALYGQDGNFQINPISYTKLDESGTELIDSATNWAMVRDDITGLVWEVKNSKDGVLDYSNPGDADNTYTWCNTDPSLNYGNPGTCVDDGTDTIGYIAALNDANYGGRSDWRLPSIKELSILVALDRLSPAIKTNYFPNTKAESGTSYLYWAATSSINHFYGWVIDFDNGNHFNSYKSDSNFVRAVSGPAIPISGERYNDNGDGTVSDSYTGLMWQQTPSAETFNWQDALAYAETLELGGNSGSEYTDWRLPSREELLSILDYNSDSFPAIDTKYFPDIGTRYWSSTSYPDSPGAWHVKSNGGCNSWSKLNLYNVRSVRGGYHETLIINLTPQSGRYNSPTTVTISGSNFGDYQGSGDVWFGDFTAIVSKWSNTEIVCQAPSQNVSTVDLTVKTDIGKTVTLAAAFTYYIDDDTDGVSDDIDLCFGHDDNIDEDYDGIPDGCDQIIDSDNDGVPDNVDLCVNTLADKAVYSDGCTALDIYEQLGQLTDEIANMYTQAELDQVQTEKDEIIAQFDVNGDGVIGLEEAIRALQILSGQRITTD